MKIAFISDVHEDYQSLKSALNKIKEIGCDQIICLGDIVGNNVIDDNDKHTHNASFCLQAILQNCHKLLKGNHDINSGNIIPKFDIDLELPNNWYKIPLNEKNEISRNLVWLYTDEIKSNLSEDQKKVISNLLDYEVIKNNKNPFLISHYAFPNLNGSLKGFFIHHQEFKEHFEFMNQLKINLSFCGHEHPNGFVIVKQNGLDEVGFNQSIKLSNVPTHIIIPAITNLSAKNGFLVFDTVLNEVIAYEL